MSAVDRILVIEDNAMNADVLRENLTDAGYESSLAVNGASGVALANELLPDIILMDVNLPILDGLSATRLLKNNVLTKGIPVVALTARAMADDRDICLSAGCDDYVSKPVDMDVLLAKVRHHIAKRPPAYVEMLRRQRAEMPAKTPTLQDAVVRPGMDLRDYEEEFAALNAMVERAEATAALAQVHVELLEEKLADQSQQLARALEERDIARRELEQTSALKSPGDTSAAELKALTIQHENLRRAFLSLQRTVAKAVEDAMHEIAFGRQ